MSFNDRFNEDDAMDLVESTMLSDGRTRTKSRKVYAGDDAVVASAPTIRDTRQNSQHDQLDHGETDDLDYGDGPGSAFNEGLTVFRLNDHDIEKHKRRLEALDENWSEVFKVLPKDYEREILCVFITDASTLLYHHLFPSSPASPRTAFHLPLLDFYYALLAEGHLAAQAFGNACSYVHKFENPDRIRKTLGNAHTAYMELKEKVTDEMVNEFSNITPMERDACPACPKEGKLFVAVDGNMQLRRRKAHANDTKKAEAATFFSADNMHDVYEKHEVINAVNKRCESELKAVTSVSAAVEKFYESGIVGCVCGRHNVPLQFTNIFASGEKYKYALSVLAVATKGYKDVNILYDLGCRFGPSFKQAFPNFAQAGSQMAVSVFHAYAHSMSCQVDYHPRFISGFGLTDGEGLERLWSYLGGFVSMTRQMSAKRRLFVLQHAIGHSKAKTIINMCYALKKRTKRAKAIIKQASAYLRHRATLVASGGTPCWWWNEDGKIDELRFEEEWKDRTIFTGVKSLSVKIQYYEELEHFYAVEAERITLSRELQDPDKCANMTMAEADEKFRLLRKVSRKLEIAEDNVTRIERVLKPERRWQINSTEYASAKEAKAKREKEDSLYKLKSHIISRKMMYDQLRNREGKIGERVSTKVRSAIKKRSTAAEKQLKLYNAACHLLLEPEVQEIMNIKRAEEELMMIEDEEKNLEAYAAARYSAIQDAIEATHDDGWQAILGDLLEQAERLQCNIRSSKPRTVGEISQIDNDEQYGDDADDEYDEDVYFVHAETYEDIEK
ncbi:hypothetical protein BDB00DRAFT_933633 [Zychaea mexicana]|uniref:uncharacterized protein n=1 Tax=Zychaea mexicana TaxID=64656 RepID=UPI0022FE4E56|nr:uncharacterized protein BDB00DRAFT_933633 [Zychaea mexicana]KAI9484485.1 hypothetical protein BDB00DRAFT_933633 [Zychaea mexicana]